VIDDYQVRSSIHHGYALPSFLHNGASFGENGAKFELEHCLIKLALLRNKGSNLVRNLQATPLAEKQRLIEADLQEIILRVRALDERLAAWEKGLYRRGFERIEIELYPSDEDIIFGNIAHYYPSLHQARVWNEYRMLALRETSL
jgi:hypothetical protein